MFKVLVVDDDSTLRMTVAAALGETYHVEQAQDGEEALSKVKTTGFHLVLLDVNMPVMDGLEALKRIKTYDPSIICIILTAYSNIKDAVTAVKEGAYNYLEKPIRAEDLVNLVDRALKAQNMAKAMSMSAPVLKLGQSTDSGEFVGQTDAMKKVFNIIDKLSKVDTAVLIRGESGTGKELVARAIHYNGPRKDERFVTVNCSAIPENLIESEFFGHEKGAFTGAETRKIGKFQYADGGTLFLDEIGDITPSMQVKLLRVLQEKKFTPIGSNREAEVNVRIVAATNRNLEEMIKSGEFREDLFYRLNVLPVFLPPLRERKDDIIPLTNYFIQKFNSQHGKKIQSVNQASSELLMSYNWPGNIRELENVIERSFVMESSEEVTPSSLPDQILKSGGLSVTSLLQWKTDSSENSLENTETNEEKAGEQIATRYATGDENGKFDFQTTKEKFEKDFIINALKTFGGKINQTAIHANIPKKTLLRKIEKYGINTDQFRQ